MENKKNKSIDNELSDASPNIISLTNSQAQVIYDQKGLDYISNLPFINKRDTGGNVVITGTVLPLTDEEQLKYNESIIVELNDRVYTNSSVNRALDTQFKYFKFPAKLTTRVVPTGSIDLPDLPVEDGLLFTGRILDVEGKLYYLEGSTYYEIAADSPQLGFPQKHLPALSFLSEKLEKPFLFRVNADDTESDKFPTFNPISKLGFAYGQITMTYNNQKGELRRRDKYSGIIDIKSETYLSDPKFEDGGILGLADLADNNITDTVVEFNFNLIDEINPAPYEFGLLVDDIGTVFINNLALSIARGLGQGPFNAVLPWNLLNTGINRIGVHAANTGGPGAIAYSFNNVNRQTFRHSKGWRVQDAYDGQYGNTLGVRPFQNIDVTENMTPSRVATNTYPEDGTYNTAYNPADKFWLGNNNFNQGQNRINAEYKWDNRGVRSAAVYRLGLNQDIGWSPKSNTNNRYGVVMVNSPLIIAVQTDNFILPNLTQVGIVVTLKYKSSPEKEIRNQIPSKSWNGFNQITVGVPAADVTEDLYQINVTQEEVPIVDQVIETLQDDQRNKESLLENAKINVETARDVRKLKQQQLSIANQNLRGQPTGGLFDTQQFWIDRRAEAAAAQSRAQTEFNDADDSLTDAQDARDTAQTEYDAAVAATLDRFNILVQPQGNS
jgi:hypothetical protein